MLNECLIYRKNITPYIKIDVKESSLCTLEAGALTIIAPSMPSRTDEGCIPRNARLWQNKPNPQSLFL